MYYSLIDFDKNQNYSNYLEFMCR